MKSIIAAIISVILLQPLVTEAAVEWAVWGPTSGSTSIGAFSGDQTVTLTAYLTGMTAGVEAVFYTSDPVITGRPDNTNPPFQSIMTGTPNTGISAGTVVATINLSTLPAGAAVTFGIADQKNVIAYGLELLDDALAALPQTDVVVTPYNITYSYDLGLGGSNVADYNSLLSGNVLWSDTTHDAGGVYAHTGLTTLSNLPPETAYIVLSVWGPAGTMRDTEGIQIYVGADLSPVPLPNLIVTYIKNPPASKKRGSSFYVKDTVMNEGTANAGEFIVRYYLSLDTIKDDSDILLKGSRTLKKLKDGKSSNGKTRVTIKKSTLPGEYYLIVCADDTNKVSESNETDNCTASNTTITVK